MLQETNASGTTLDSRVTRYRDLIPAFNEALASLTGADTGGKVHADQWWAQWWKEHEKEVREKEKK